MFKPIVVEPITVAVTPGTSVDITLPATLDVTVGRVYTLVMTNVLQNRTGTEEVVITVDGTTYAAVDNFGVYVTSQMLHNPDKYCPPLQSNVFRIQFTASGTETVVAFRRGLAPRRTTIAVVAPPTP